MLTMHLLARSHPSVILVYSVPTKQVLKAVGLQCEAHKLMYWTAGARDEFQVRRPFSIRTQQSKRLTAKSGTILEQLAQAEKQGREHGDRGGGRPAVLIADVWSTAELLRRSRCSCHEAEDASDEILLMLSAGIAYASASGAEPLVSRLYRQTLLHVPERAFAATRPPIHVLCVDYTSIYRTDSVAVDTLVMSETLGQLLTWSDHVQFLG